MILPSITIVIYAAGMVIVNQVSRAYGGHGTGHVLIVMFWPFLAVLLINEISKRK